MKGRIVQINVSQGGVPKLPVPRAFVSVERVEGDDWSNKDVHGGTRQVILMISVENIEKLKAEGYPLFSGALGENFPTEGIDYRQIRYADVFRAGDTLEFRITKRRGPCKTITVYGKDIGTALFDAEASEHRPESTHWGMSGFYGEILKEGTVRTGDDIVKIN
jgi:MOSC domain-containing protein YiiM